MQTANNKRCHFLGNVTVGRDISLSELRTAYTAVVLVSGPELAAVSVSALDLSYSLLLFSQTVRSKHIMQCPMPQASL